MLADGPAERGNCIGDPFGSVIAVATTRLTGAVIHCEQEDVGVGVSPNIGGRVANRKVHNDLRAICRTVPYR